jgi:hypothetical protein
VSEGERENATSSQSSATGVETAKKTRTAGPPLPPPPPPSNPLDI